MSSNILYIFLLTLIVVGAAVAQSEEIPIENDNQAPDAHLDTPDDAEEMVEGSGKGTTDDTDFPLEYDTSTTVIPLEEVESTAITEEEPTTSDPDNFCPTPCMCSVEDNDFVTDCSSYGLTEFPSPLNPETTVLKINNNKITEIPKDVSSLKNLKVLNAENNSIMEVVPGSISELPELTVLNLANNRLLEVPLDLKNSFTLNHLEQLDLGGNDIRTDLTLDFFSNFESLWKLTLPKISEELLQDLCGKMKNMYIICTGSCDVQSHECSDILSTTEAEDEDDIADATLPGTIALYEEDSDSDPTLNNMDTKEQNETEAKLDADEELVPVNISPNNSIISEAAPADEIPQLSRSGGIKEEVSLPQSNLNDETENQKDVNKTESDVKVGATTESSPGGINKSVIGFVVAGMVVIVAGITIGKNWRSISRRFKSNSRTPERGGTNNANGSSPEQVPLKEKSPV